MHVVVTYNHYFSVFFRTPAVETTSPGNRQLFFSSAFLCFLLSSLKPQLRMQQVLSCTSAVPRKGQEHRAATQTYNKNIQTAGSKAALTSALQCCRTGTLTSFNTDLRKCLQVSVELGKKIQREN